MLKNTDRLTNKDTSFTIRDFCVYCGAKIPPIYGEGTCPRCDPIGCEEHKEQVRGEAKQAIKESEGEV